jgi:hypothetical protein
MMWCKEILGGLSPYIRHKRIHCGETVTATVINHHVIHRIDNLTILLSETIADRQQMTKERPRDGLMVMSECI